jgi:hypothetical protein
LLRQQGLNREEDGARIAALFFDAPRFALNDFHAAGFS